MKKIIATLVCLSIVSITVGCGSNKTIDGYTYGTYGLFNESDMKNEMIEYQVIIGNVVWACILVETIIAPIYFIGWSLYEPIGKKAPKAPKGSVS